MNEMEKLNNISLLNTEEVAELLQVSPATIGLWRAKGMLKYYQFNNRTIRYSRKHIAEFLKKMEKDNYVEEVLDKN
jgi:predicted site-specific integrase-resolvase